MTCQRLVEGVTDRPGDRTAAGPASRPAAAVTTHRARACLSEEWPR
ncbi:hypothetical protein FHR32_005718 [Streptosporangium album]|uniref:Uncharacterized protein n=1 Tax=Streptosporangium album TaxID=47479 RepID=A0A7W7WBT2_9ACTN|nr:hypothetical protein [Streptosporangium album]MBB4941341.1 hypothetical protein [Streptosporangium album]